MNLTDDPGPMNFLLFSFSPFRSKKLRKTRCLESVYLVTFQRFEWKVLAILWYRLCREVGGGRIEGRWSKDEKRIFGSSHFQTGFWVNLFLNLSPLKINRFFAVNGMEFQLQHSSLLPLSQHFTFYQCQAQRSSSCSLTCSRKERKPC